MCKLFSRKSIDMSKVKIEEMNDETWKSVQRIYNEGIAAKNVTFQTGIFPENKAITALHLKNGFRILGIKEKIGKMDNLRRDTAMLERRSKVVGIN